MSSKTKYLAAGLLLAVLLVSSYDSYRCVADLVMLEASTDSLEYVGESNPLARWLIETGGVRLLMGAKMFGTGLVMSVVSLMIYTEWSKLWYVIWALVLAQLYVLWHYALGMFPYSL
jgi:hypothetical protein